MIDLKDLFQSQQKILQSSDYLELIRQQAERFQKAQDQAINEVQTAVNGWLERRREAAHAIADVVKLLSQTKDFGAASQALRGYSEASWQRVLDDARDQVNVCMHLASQSAGASGLAAALQAAMEPKGAKGADRAHADKAHKVEPMPANTQTPKRPAVA